MSQVVENADVRASKAMRAELDMFSGRPNPTRELTTAERAEFRRWLASLPEAHRSQFPSRLGYRGIKLADSNDEHASGEIEVGGGTVILRGAGGTERTLADPGCAFERWLLSTARGQLQEDLREMASRQLDDSCPAH